MPTCAWCRLELDSNHGYSRDHEPICCSYSNPPSRAYSRCKSRKNRLASKKGSSEASTSAVGHSSLIEALQIIINQNDELIALQKQALSQPRQLVKEETIKTIHTTKEFSTPDFGEDDMDIEIKRDSSTSSVQNFLDSMNNIQNIGKVQ